MKKALITGITGQDGSYLTELLLEKGYEVHGLVRPVSSFNRSRLDKIYLNQKIHDRKLFLHYGDLADSSSLNGIINKINPAEIYNLGAQSHVKKSFDIPEYTSETDAIGVLRILDCIKTSRENIKFYQASTSELFGNSSDIPQNENTIFSPCSPYASSKLFGYWVTRNYKEAYDIYAVNGILFNHESPRRGRSFVTRKITHSAVMIKNNLQEKLYLGNLSAKRDWGYAKEYVEAMWLMLQKDKPDDYVIATGKTYSVREFCTLAFYYLGINLDWKGKGVNEKGFDKKTGKIVVEVNPYYFRPNEVECLQGDASKALNELGWKPKVTFEELVKIMVESDQKILDKKKD